MITAELLQQVATQQKLSHAYLFSGNDTEKKKELIENFLDSIGVQVADRITVQGIEAEIPIAKIRELSAFFAMSAWNSPFKVAVIENAHTMNKEAQSAFLKLLEEPKGNTIFFLLTAHPDLLLDTIRSRSQEFKFYKFTSTVDSDVATEFKKLQKASLHDRFAYAKKLADTPEEIPQKLESWLASARQDMLQNLKNKPAEAEKNSQTIKTIQEVMYALQTSNVNSRLALERIMIDL